MSREDSQLVARVLSGHEDAYAKLYKKYARKIYNLVLRLVGVAQEAEELTQEVFFQAYKNLPRFKGKSQFYTWLYRVATNTTLQWLRKRGREKGDSSFEFLEENAPQSLRPAAAPDPSVEVERREIRGRIRDALESLPYNQKVVMVLGPIQGLSYEEMSEVLGVSVTVIKGRLHRARENLRDRYKSLKKTSQSSITFSRYGGLTEPEAYERYENALTDVPETAKASES